MQAMAFETVCRRVALSLSSHAASVPFIDYYVQLIIYDDEGRRAWG